MQQHMRQVREVQDTDTLKKYLMTTNELITLCINLLQNHRVIQRSLSCSIRQRVLSASSQQNNIRYMLYHYYSMEDKVLMAKVMKQK